MMIGIDPGTDLSPRYLVYFRDGSSREISEKIYRHLERVNARRNGDHLRLVIDNEAKE